MSARRISSLLPSLMTVAANVKAALLLSISRRPSLALPLQRGLGAVTYSFIHITHQHLLSILVEER